MAHLLADSAFERLGASGAMLLLTLMGSVKNFVHTCWAPERVFAVACDAIAFLFSCEPIAFLFSCDCVHMRYRTRNLAAEPWRGRELLARF